MEGDGEVGHAPAVAGDEEVEHVEVPGFDVVGLAGPAEELVPTRTAVAAPGAARATPEPIGGGLVVGRCRRWQRPPTRWTSPRQ